MLRDIIYFKLNMMDTGTGSTSQQNYPKHEVLDLFIYRPIFSTRWSQITKKIFIKVNVKIV